MALEPDKSSVTLDKSLHLSEPQFPQVQSGVTVRKPESPCMRHRHRPVTTEGSHWVTSSPALGPSRQGLSEGGLGSSVNEREEAGSQAWSRGGPALGARCLGAQRDCGDL